MIEEKPLSLLKIEFEESEDLVNSLCPWDKKLSHRPFDICCKVYDAESQRTNTHYITLPTYKELCNKENVSDIDKTLAMLTATSYKELRELAKGSTERMALYIMIRKLAEDPEFMKLYEKKVNEDFIKQKKNGHK